MATLLPGKQKFNFHDIIVLDLLLHMTRSCRTFRTYSLASYILSKVWHHRLKFWTRSLGVLHSWQWE